MEPPKGPKIPKIPKFEMPKMPGAAAPKAELPPLPAGVPPKKIPKIPSFDPKNPTGGPPKGFMAKHSTVLNLLPVILIAVAGIGYGAYKLFWGKKKKAGGAAVAGSPDGGSGPPAKVCAAPPGEAPLEVTTDDEAGRAKEDAQKITACVLKAGRSDDYRFKIKPRDDGQICDSCPWQLVVRTGEALQGEVLDLDPGLDVNGKISAGPSKKAGLSELKLKLLYVRARGPEECSYIIKGSMGGFEIVPGDCVTPEEKTEKPPQ